MKTAREYFERFREPFRSQTIANTSLEGLKKVYFYDFFALEDSFTWSSTQEGFEYWKNFYDALKIHNSRIHGRDEIILKTDLDMYFDKTTFFTSRIAQQYFEVYDTQETVKLLKLYSEYYTEKFSGAKLGAISENAQAKFDNQFDFIPMQGIAYNIIISYSKMFDNSSSVQQFVLGRQLFNGDENLLKTHDLIINTRNKYIAQDEDMFGLKPKVLIGFDSSGYMFMQPDKVSKSIVGFPFIEKENLFPVLEKIENYLLVQIQKKEARVENQANIIFQKYLNDLLVKVRNGDIITQEHFDSWNRGKNIEYKKGELFYL